MQLRNWQQKIVDSFPTILKQHRRFILKAPTGAGKTVLASELVERFYKNKKIIVLCHRLVLLEQLERALSKKHRVRKLTVSDKGPAFEDYEILLSTNMRAKHVLTDAVPKADLIIIDEPTEGLAPKIVELVGQYLQTIKSRGISVLLIEQKLTIAMKISDRALVMGHGSIVFQGTPDSLRADSYIRKEWLEV